MSTSYWMLFSVLVAAMLFLDIKVFNRKAHVIHFKESLLWSLFWTIVALVFNAFVYVKMGSDKATEFLTAYLVERALSVDNLFVFVAVFSYFRVPAQYQHGILFWGILGAMAMRAIFIMAGVALLAQLHFLFYIFGLILIYTAYKLLFEQQQEIKPEDNPVVKLFRKFFTVSPKSDVSTFFVMENGKRVATYLFIVLLVIETTDVIFAIDSIPAVLAISRDPFIVYTSNVFAIFGLRALFFALADSLRLFHYLNYGLSFILAFIGIKMLIADFFHVPVGVTLSVVCGVLLLSVIVSLIWPKKTPEAVRASGV